MGWEAMIGPSLLFLVWLAVAASLVLAAVSQAGLKLRASPSLEPELKMFITTPSLPVTSFFPNKSPTVVNLSCLLFNCKGGSGS